MKSLGSRAIGERLERMRASLRWVGDGFRNLHPIAPGLRDATAAMPSLRDFLCVDPQRVPSAPLPAFDPRPAWVRRPGSGLRATWLGHSTVLLELDGWRVLTDPVWGSRASPSRLVGPRRFQPVPVALGQMPPVDLIVISHDHYDHLDYPTIRALARSRVPFVVSLGVGAHLQAWGIEPERIHELDWWETFALPGTGIEVTAAPAQHFSGRGLKDRNATLWSSLVIRSPRHAVFFSGDTGLTSEYGAIRERLGPFDLVLLEVGAHHPAWGDIHLGPDNALAAHALLGSGTLLPVHWGTFALATHAWDQPANRLFERADMHPLPVAMPRLGESIEPAQLEPATPWWRPFGTPDESSATAAPDRPASQARQEPRAPAADELGRAARIAWPLD